MRRVNPATEEVADTASETIPFASDQNKNPETDKFMTLKDIAVFKHFIAGKNLYKPFINVYNGSKAWAKLPDHIEEYFSNVEPLAVITKAARVCKPNATFGYDFWQDLNEDWKEAYKKIQSSHFYEDLQGMESLSGYFNILRENWNDAMKPWKFEPVEVARVRLGLAESYDDDCNTQDKQEQNVPETIEDTDDLGIEFIDIERPSRIANVLHKGFISVNIRSGSFKVSVNREDSKDVKKKEPKFAQIGNTRSGDVVIQFNRNKGIPIKITSDGYCNINSRIFVETTRKLLSITKDLEYVRIEKIAENMDSITYKVTRQ
jgi:hypothetical protein